MKPSVTSDSEVMGGTPCLAGTRVPIQTFLEYVDGPEGIAGFLANFPSLWPALATEALRYAGRISEADELAKALLRQIPNCGLHFVVHNGPFDAFQIA